MYLNCKGLLTINKVGKTVIKDVLDWIEKRKGNLKGHISPKGN